MQLRARGWAVAAVVTAACACVPAAAPAEEAAPAPVDTAPAPSTPPSCVVPAVAQGATQTDAHAAISAAGCTVGTTTALRSEVARDHVVSVSPDPGTELPAGSGVDLVVSAGQCVVPAIAPGTSLDAATTALAAAGCTLGARTSARSLVRRGRAIRAGLPAGTVLDYASTVPIVTSWGAGPALAQMRAAAAYALGRRATVSWAAIDASGRMYSFRGSRRYRTASVVKAMILVARLRQYRRSALPRSVRNDLHVMITRSDNGAAKRQFKARGAARQVRVLARNARMTRFQMPSSSNWGTIRFSATDQARLFYGIDMYMPPRHRAWGMRQLQSVIPAQRWGIAAARRRYGPHWALAFKGGWLGRDCGQIEHQVALFVRPGERFSLAVLSECNATSAYGRGTQFGIARRLIAL